MSDPKGIEGWIDFIRSADLPLFNKTLHQLNDAKLQSQVQISDITSVVLHDPNLTASVLKLANSAYYNRQRKQVSTISRAVVMLGIQTLNSICVSAMMLSNVATKSAPQTLLSTLARSFFRAHIAKRIVMISGNMDQEEAYIAALLKEFGRIAYWHLAGPTRDKLQKKLDAGENMNQAEMEVLGFSLNQLSLALFREWHIQQWLLPANVQDAVENSGLANITLADKCSFYLMLNWKHPATDKIRYELGSWLKIKPPAVEQLLEQSLLETAQVLIDLELPFLIEYLPHPPVSNPTIREIFAIAEPDKKPTIKRKSKPDNLLSPDLELQLHIMQDLTQLVHNTPDSQLLIQLIVEGIHKGVGLERVVFATLEPNGCIKARYVLQQKITPILQQLDLTTTSAAQFQAVWELKQPIWLGPRPAKNYLSAELAQQLGCKACVVGPIVVNDKVKAIIYADQGVSQQPLLESQFQQFSMFIGQAEMALKLINNRR